MCSKKPECSLGMIQAWRNGHSGVLPTGASSKTMHMVIQIRMWTLSNDIKKAAASMRLARDSGKGKLFFPMPDKEPVGWTAQIIQHEIDHCNGILI